jgi:WD40 repeat protein
MQENALHGWRLGDGEHLRMTGYPAKSRSLSWSAKGRWLLTSGAPAVVAWPFAGRDGPIGKPALELGPATRLVTRVAGHPTQEVLAAGHEDGAVRLLRLPDGAGREIARGEGAVAALAWSPGGNALAWGTEGGSAGVFAPARAAA